MKTFQSKLRSTSPWLFWILIIAVTALLLIEMPPSENDLSYGDKVVHAMLFATLAAIGYFAYINHRIWLYVGLAIYGGMTELMQGALTITRQASLMDWVADITGILLCALICNIYNARAKAT